MKMEIIEAVAVIKETCKSNPNCVLCPFLVKKGNWVCEFSIESVPENWKFNFEQEVKK